MLLALSNCTEPVVSDTYAEIRREMSRKYLKLSDLPEDSEESKENNDENDNSQSEIVIYDTPAHNSTPGKTTNHHLYSIAEPVGDKGIIDSPEPVLIKNDLYEMTTPMCSGTSKDLRSESGELVDNDLYSSN